MATAAYPAWEDIPSPPPTSTASSSSTPLAPPAPSTSRSLTSSLARFFSLFPLHQFPAAQPLYPEDDTRVTKPTLYVAPGHAREKNGRVERTWTSADARCLRWQMELLFRSSPSLQGYEVDGSRASTSGSKSTGHFDCEQIEHQDAWGPKIDSLPYLQLPPHGKGKVVPSSTAYVPSAPPRLLDDEALPTWAETRWPFEWEKVEKHGAEEERGQKMSGAYESEEKRLEAEMWTSLLEGKIMGAVLLAQMICSPPTSPSSLPLFSSLLHTHLTTQRLNRRAHHISTLTIPSLPRSATLSRGASWSSWLPSLNFSLDGPLRGTGGGVEPGTEVVGWPEGEEWDEKGIVEDAVQGLRAVAGRMGKSSIEEPAGGWFLGASQPTGLDALLFAVLHTILSLPGATGNQVVQRLRAAVQGEGDEKAGVLAAWAKRVYGEWVKEREIEWQRVQD